jgi:prevent-host-death family protein
MRYSEGMRVSIREFKAQAVELVRRAEAGEEVTITRGSRAVAVLKPPQTTKEEKAAEEMKHLDRLIAAGLVIPPDPATRPRMLDPNWKPIRGKGKPLSQIVIEQRREGL